MRVLRDREITLAYLKEPGVETAERLAKEAGLDKRQIFRIVERLRPWAESISSDSGASVAGPIRETQEAS